MVRKALFATKPINNNSTLAAKQDPTHHITGHHTTPHHESWEHPRFPQPASHDIFPPNLRAPWVFGIARNWACFGHSAWRVLHGDKCGARPLLETPMISAARILARSLWSMPHLWRIFPPTETSSANGEWWRMAFQRPTPQRQPSWPERLVVPIRSNTQLLHHTAVIRPPCLFHFVPVLCFCAICSVKLEDCLSSFICGRYLCPAACKWPKRSAPKPFSYLTTTTWIHQFQSFDLYH